MNAACGSFALAPALSEVERGGGGVPGSMGLCSYHAPYVTIAVY